MRHNNRFYISLILAGLLLAVTPPARAQSDEEPSVAEAARKARQQKKNTADESKVITNDTLPPPKLKPEITIPTATEPMMPGEKANSQESPATGNSAKGATEATSEDDAQKKEEEKKALEALKRQIREMKGQVDLAQRTLSLANDDFYSKPDFSKDSDGKAKLDALQGELAEKKDELAQLLAKLPAGESADEKKTEQPPQQ